MITRESSITRLVYGYKKDEDSFLVVIEYKLSSARSLRIYAYNWKGSIIYPYVKLYHFFDISMDYITYYDIDNVTSVLISGVLL